MEDAAHCTLNSLMSVIPWANAGARPEARSAAAPPLPESCKSLRRVISVIEQSIRKSSVGIPRMSALLLRQDNTCDHVYEGP